jgi:hypothetical protein
VGEDALFIGRCWALFALDAADRGERGEVCADSAHHAGRCQVSLGGGAEVDGVSCGFGWRDFWLI